MRIARLSLRTRIVLLVGAMATAALAGGIVTMAYMVWLGSVLATISDQDVAAMRVARELETSLVMQKGFATYFAQDRDPSWLDQLDEYRNSFSHWLKRAEEIGPQKEARALLEQIKREYELYDQERAAVIELYRSGKEIQAQELHREIRRRFLTVRSLCESYSQLHERHMESARAEISRRADFINDMAMATLPAVVMLAAALGYVLVRQVFEPIRQLASSGMETDDGLREQDEVKALTKRVRGLMEDVDQTKLQLEKSQEQLIRSEKLALVGKLAAGVAHSIRNPLTSVKMRLFSLEKELLLTPEQREDLAVVSEEIRQIESMVQNFLEFSRPPKLRLSWVSPSQVVDSTVELLKKRCEAHGIEIVVERGSMLPQTWLDPERVKEVLVNLIVNAMEAMGPKGGKITIRERTELTGDLSELMVLEVEDNGPGIPAAIVDKVLEPFFSTKEEGTGLGLSIAARIVEEHGGWMELKSQEGKGATFTITLPRRWEAWEPS
jgi:signal transduction histidine kinase